MSKTLEALIRSGYDTFISGGALGFDLISAEAVVNLKSVYPNIRLIFALPCKGHDIKWKVDERIRLSVLLRYCDDVVFVSDLYSSDCMLKRNRYMVDNSSYCISYCTRDTGGTAYTVRYAKAAGIGLTEISGKV